MVPQRVVLHRAGSSGDSTLRGTVFGCEGTRKGGSRWFTYVHVHPPLCHLTSTATPYVCECWGGVVVLPTGVYRVYGGGGGIV